MSNDRCQPFRDAVLALLEAFPLDGRKRSAPKNRPKHLWDVWDHFRHNAEETKPQLATVGIKDRITNKIAGADIDLFAGAIDPSLKANSIFFGALSEKAADSIFSQIRSTSKTHQARLPAILMWMWCRSPLRAHKLFLAIRNEMAPIDNDESCFSEEITEHFSEQNAQKLQELAAEGPPQKYVVTPQPALKKAIIQDSITHYTSKKKLDIIGREIEEAALRRFTASENLFSWVQLAGIAGQGKSRLAYELWLELEEIEDQKRWRCGFVDADVIESFQNHWSDWQPDRPYLLVADYVIGQEVYIAKLFGSLMRGANKFQN